MFRRSLRALVAPLLAISALAATAAPALASPEKIGPPTSITALGDSITRGYNSQGTACVAFTDCPAFSWATGSNATVNSYFNRVKALNPSVTLSNPLSGNDAVTGAKVGELATQATKAVKGNPDLVLIEIGANDVCTSSEATMTSVASFRTSLIAGLNVISSKTPDARIAISSIPNIFQLWNVLHKTTGAQLIWGLGKICQSMLASPTSEASADKTRRANVQKRNEEDNAVLAEVCAEYIHCHYDGGAAYAVNFLASEVNTNDYFHPDVAGQADLASVAFKNGPNYADLSTPTTTITSDREPDSSEGWYRSNVQLTLSATAGEYPVKGTEYKIGEAESWTRYTGPITISSEGQTTITARSVDVNGDTEASKALTIDIDKTAPTLSVSCPTAPVLLGSVASATVEAVDSGAGFLVGPSGSAPLSTLLPGNNQTESVTVEDRAGNKTTQTCSYDVQYPDPGAPSLVSGATPNADGLFSLAWSGASPGGFGIGYTLQRRDADAEEWSTVAEGLSSLTFAYSGAGEQEGTWTYRVKGIDLGLGLTTAWSAPSSPIVVDESAPAAPSASADRALDYAGDGGWYKDAVTVSFTANGDPALLDGSPGSGVDLSSLSGDETFTSDGSHTATGTIADNVGNLSPAANLTVQVDASPPSLQITCPASVLLGSKGVAASVLAADGQSGLSLDPSGTVPIETNILGPQTVTRTATDNVGHETSESCTTQVVAGTVLTGEIKGPLKVKAGQSVELAPGAKVNGKVTVEPAGSLDVEQASISKALGARGAGIVRLCGATIGGVLKVSAGTAPVVVGDGGTCAPSSVAGAASLLGNTAGVTVVGSSFTGALKVTASAGGTRVTGNTVGKALTVTGNSGSVTDRPNQVTGRSKLQ